MAPNSLATTPKRLHREYTETGFIGHQLRAANALATEINRLTTQLSVIRLELLQHMAEKQLDQMTCGDLYCIKKTRHNWSYSSETEREMQKVRNSQKWEQAQEIAQDSPTTFIQLGVLQR
jgi:hypothetical protein